MLPFKLSETSLRRQVNDKSWSRGQSYYRSGSVMNVVCRGSTIQAQVEGSDYEPYRVNLSVGPGGFKSASCSCPYDWGGWCKHIAAVGMLCCRAPQRVKLAAPIEDILESLGVEDLRDLILELLDKEPGLIDQVELFNQRPADLDNSAEEIEVEAEAVETEVVGKTIRSSRKVSLLRNQSAAKHQSSAQPQSAPSQPRQRQTQVDPAPYREQAHRAIRKTVQAMEEGWNDYYDMETEIFDDLLAKPKNFIEAGDGANGLVILEAITGALIQDWSKLEDYGYEVDIAGRVLDPLWAEALLQAELSNDEAADWQDQLDNYAVRFGWEELPLASEALRQDWEDLALQEVLAGNATELWEYEPPAHADELAQIRLRILARQNRWDEYLNFAYAEEQFRDWLVMLIQQGEGEQVLAEIDSLETVDDAQAVAEAFRARGELEAAIAVAQQGLKLPSRIRFSSDSRLMTSQSDDVKPGPRHHELAAWAAQLAEQVEDEETTLGLWVEAIAAQPKLADFEHLKLLAGEAWPGLRDRLLDQLEASEPGFDGEGIDILLAEGRVQAAIQRLEKGYFPQSKTLEVMKAAVGKDPDWVIRKGTTEADDIMDRGKSDKYDLAIKYLKPVKAAYLHQGKQSDWTAYRYQIQAKHFRKRKLMTMMKGARLD